MADRLHDTPVARGFTLGDPPSVGLRTAVRRLHLAGRLGALLGLHTLHLATDFYDSAVLTVLAYTGPWEGKRYSDVADASGVRDGQWGWGTEFLDYNNDGLLDIYGANGFVSGPVLDDV